jgi:hypothetical protein
VARTQGPAQDPRQRVAAGSEPPRRRPGPGYYWRRGKHLARAGYVGFRDARMRVNQNAIGRRQGEWCPARIAVYYPDSPVKIYQLQQWLPVFEQVHAELPVVLVTRSQFTHERLGELTWLPRVCVPKLGHLTDLYQHSDLAVALYVNNGARNFQSLSWPRMLHVHINHGESDKVSMVSNQAKAYDRVAVAGDAARQRHQAALIEFDDDRLIPIGRPQLDLLPAAALPASDRPTILYAPTWQGETEHNNYSSVDVFGPQIVRALVSLPGVRVVYKPHPRTVTSTVPGVASAHHDILAALEAGVAADPGAGHTALLDADILGVLPMADIFVGDVSSVTLDFLYLRADKPILLCDRFDDPAQLVAASPAAAAADVITASTVDRLADTVARRLRGDDPHRDERRRIREIYFGAHRPGESVEHFVRVLRDLVRRRDVAVARMESGPHIGLAPTAGGVELAGTDLEEAGDPGPGPEGPEDPGGVGVADTLSDSRSGARHEDAARG